MTQRPTLALFTLAPIARMTRGAMLQALNSDFIRTARAAGLSPRVVLNRYAFRNAMLPVITTLGMVFSFTLGANVLVEKVFAWPGIGRLMFESLTARDYNTLLGVFLVSAAMVIAFNIITDIVYRLIDPRI